MAVALRFIGLLLLLTLGACIKTTVHPEGSREPARVSARYQGEYTVRPGDTLYSIARQYGIDYHELARRNHLSYPYTIHVGQALTIGGAPTAAASVSRIYKVRPGDTLYSIAKRYGIDYHELARRNHLGHPYTIYIGQELHLAGVAPRSTLLPGLKSGESSSSTSASGTVSSAAAQTVQPAANGRVPRLQWPLNGTITSGFGSRGSRMHDGVDIGAPAGTPVRAAADGEVVYSDHRLSGYGNLIILRHGGDVFTAYAHNQRNLVRKGDRVKQGDVIARVGETGRASGPHLHFEVRRGSTPVDPLAYLPSR
ncbi:MAG TPA: M23 family metallopeptidase [Mariprofundaceae bacterium]|nr:M23 family metallopeptidase [Mariprofundaceae bacterium]